MIIIFFQRFWHLSQFLPVLFSFFQFCPDKNRFLPLFSGCPRRNRFLPEETQPCLNTKKSNEYIEIDIHHAPASTAWPFLLNTWRNDNVKTTSFYVKVTSRWRNNVLLLRDVSAGYGQHFYLDTYHPSTSSARFAICTFSSAQFQCKQRPKRIRM